MSDPSALQVGLPAPDITTQAQTAFISGPIDTGPDALYFKEHYIKPIDAAVQRGDHFIIGPIPSGVDAEALAYLLEARGVERSRITIFVTQDEERIWGEKFRGLGVQVHAEGKMPHDRDAAMTRESNYDILRWRPVEEAKMFYGDLWRRGHVTNTERNWRRRRGLREYDEYPEAESRGAATLKEMGELNHRGRNLQQRLRSIWKKKQG